MRFIATEKIEALLTRLGNEGKTVWAPRVVQDTLNTVLFTAWDGLAEIAMEGYTTLSAKELLLPATEVLFGFRYLEAGGPGDLRIDSPGEEEAGAVLFGGRPCDAKAITVLDALFTPEPGGGYNDPYYRRRRQRLTVLTLACTTCDSACFCSSFEGGPAAQAGSDMLLYPVEGGFLAEPVTAAGEAIAAGEPFGDSEMAPPALARTAAVDLGRIDVHLNRVFSRLDFWERAAGVCLSCGLCAHACPTCYCFNIFDEMRSDRQGERLRAWDACMFSLYTRETSGHNPRPTSAHRYRNRIMHKFSYYPAAHGEALCTGCGRCIRACPAGMDIREVLTAARVRASETTADRKDAS